LQKKIKSDRKEKTIPVKKNPLHLPVGEQNRKKTKSPTLGEIAERFLRWYKSVREPASYRTHKTSSKSIIKFFGSNMPFEEINNGKVEEYKLWRKEQGVSPVTINKELRFLATMINRAVEFEWIL